MPLSSPNRNLRDYWAKFLADTPAPPGMYYATDDNDLYLCWDMLDGEADPFMICHGAAGLTHIQSDARQYVALTPGNLRQITRRQEDAEDWWTQNGDAVAAFLEDDTIEEEL